jgi:RNA polymerase sigma-70 factor (ECF subfamily)
MNGANQAALLNVHVKEREAVGDKEIVAAAQAGSPGAFTEIYAVYSRRLYKTIFAITKHSEDAEDALQETFLRAHMSFHTFEGRSNVYSWLTRIAINSALMILRKRRARPEVLFDPQPDAQADTFGFEVRDPAPTPEQVYDLRHRRVRLVRAIRNLDAKLRKPIQMRMARESSIKEIGRALKISEAAVKTRLHRARLRISAACRES